ncbi:MAG: FtsX-like permease family protein [Vicinamibacterales bacterium]
MALGASRGEVFGHVMAGGQRLTALGAVLGFAGAYAGGRLVASRIFAMNAADPVVLLTAGATVIAVAALATLVPATRASRLAPARALRPDG